MENKEVQIYVNPVVLRKLFFYEQVSYYLVPTQCIWYLAPANLHSIGIEIIKEEFGWGSFF
jgi:hypothetical protein